MAESNESILSRVERLDIMIGYLEEIKGFNKSAKSSCPSTPSSATTTTNGGNSSVTSSPKSLERRCRPIDAVILEIQAKGNIVDRLVQLENRILKLSLLLEEQIENETKKGEEKRERKKHKHGLKQLVAACVGSTLKTKH